MAEPILSNSYDYVETKGFKEGSYTHQSANNLGKTWNDAGGRFQNAFSVEYQSTDTLGKDAAELVYDSSVASAAHRVLLQPQSLLVRLLINSQTGTRISTFRLSMRLMQRHSII